MFDGAVLVELGAVAAFFVGPPLPDVCSPISPSHRALPLKHVVLKLTKVDSPRVCRVLAPLIGPFSMLLPIAPITYILGTVRVGIRPLALVLVRPPVASIRISVLPDHGTPPIHSVRLVDLSVVPATRVGLICQVVHLIFSEGAYEPRAIGKSLRSVAVFLPVFPPTIVDTPIGVDLDTETVSLVIFPLALVQEAVSSAEVAKSIPFPSRIKLPKILRAILWKQLDCHVFLLTEHSTGHTPFQYYWHGAVEVVWTGLASVVFVAVEVSFSFVALLIILDYFGIAAC